jgi:hypothetical protein
MATSDLSPQVRDRAGDAGEALAALLLRDEQVIVAEQHLRA